MKIALGMSGGIDSTMCALLLMEQGHQVTGITMAKWNPASGINSADKKGCFGPSEPEALKAAVLSAQKLGVQHHIINLEHEFSAEILSYYRAMYLAGLTPNPCVMCNRYIKFGALLQKARELGVVFSHFATGHYARIDYDDVSGRWQLKKALDPTKDQSYFLGLLSQEQLASTLFPLGNMHKSEIREFAMAKGYQYLVKKKESQDFLESNDKSPLFQDFPIGIGDIIDTSGKRLGKHKGLIHYTIGQRKGLGVAGFETPRYVVEIDARQNRIVLGTESELYCDHLIAAKVNWVSIAEPEKELVCTAKIRLASNPVPCHVTKAENGDWQVKFTHPVSAITPGQLVAFYEDDILLGAGFIRG